MPRTARLVIPGVAHHITHHGNGRSIIFTDNQDRWYYLSLLRSCSTQYGLKLLGYCLMDTHIHLVGIPEHETSLARAIGVTHLRYAQQFNCRYKQHGHLWETRFYSCPMDDSHMVAAVKYVERNPVRAGLVDHAWHYRWSSAGEHIEDRKPSGLLDLEAWWRNWPPQVWRVMLHQGDDEATTKVIRLRTRLGRPLGSIEFMKKSLNQAKNFGL